MQNSDQLIGRSHGDRIVCPTHGKLAFLFRAGPVPCHARWGWDWCSCEAFYSKGHQGKVKKARGSYWGRCRKGGHSIVRAAVSAMEDGFKIRGGLRKVKRLFPKWWDDAAPAHVEKNWKSYRKTQWKLKA